MNNYPRYTDIINFYSYLNTDSNLSFYKYGIDTTNAVLTATLPATPSVGNEIEIFDIAGKWDVNNLIVANNGRFIEGINDNLLCNVKFGLIKLIYTGGTIGWRIIPLPVQYIGIVPSVPPVQGDPESPYLSLLLNFNP